MLFYQQAQNFYIAVLVKQSQTKFKKVKQSLARSNKIKQSETKYWVFQKSALIDDRFKQKN